MADFNSPFYPYEKVYPGYLTGLGSELIPDKLMRYIMDLPDAEGYEPKDDNTRPRVKLMKYLWYDGAKPLNELLPTIQQKMSVVFDPNNPQNPPTDKGYRLIPQVFRKQSEENARTSIYVYLGRTVPIDDEFKIALSVHFRIWTHYTYELNTKSDVYSVTKVLIQDTTQSLH